MKTLFLLRHAKSSWDDSFLSDFDRPLAPRGERDAPRIGEFLAAQEDFPEIIVSSPAARAKMTSELVADAASFDGDMMFDHRIYMGSSDTLLEVVRDLPDDVDEAMLVGHNPGFEELVEDLCGGIARMPTAALACIDLDVDSWADADIDTGTLRWLITPKLLP